MSDKEKLEELIKQMSTEISTNNESTEATILEIHNLISLKSNAKICDKETKHLLISNVLAYFVNKEQPKLTEQYARQYLEMDKWTSAQKTVIMAKLGASIANQGRLEEAEQFFLGLSKNKTLDKRHYIEVLRNLCTTRIRQKDFDKLITLLDFSFFYDVCLYFEKCNEFKNEEFFTPEAFTKMTHNDIVRPLDQIFIDEDMPKSLFKYRSLSKKYFKKTLDNIGIGQLYLSNPKDFNDPFDPIFKIDKKHKKFMDKIAPNIQIGCLSGINDSVLMWSHYADSHKGICIEYDIEHFTSKKSWYWTLRRVKYIDEMELPSELLINTDDYFHSILDMFALKHKDWEYEKEYRILAAPIPFSVSKLLIPIKSIYLGKDISRKYKKEILDYCESCQIDVFQACTDSKDNVFKISFKKLS